MKKESQYYNAAGQQLDPVSGLPNPVFGESKDEWFRKLTNEQRKMVHDRAGKDTGGITGTWFNTVAGDEARGVYDNLDWGQQNSQIAANNGIEELGNDKISGGRWVNQNGVYSYLNPETGRWEEYSQAQYSNMFPTASSITKNLKLAQNLVNIAEELEDEGLIDEVDIIDNIIDILAQEAHTEHQMMKQAQLLSEKFQGITEGIGGTIGGLAGAKAGWNAGSGPAKLLGALGGGLLGAGVGAGAGYLATGGSGGIDQSDPDAIQQLSAKEIELSRELEKIKTMKQALILKQNPEAVPTRPMHVPQNPEPGMQY